MRISDWSSDVCSSDLREHGRSDAILHHLVLARGQRRDRGVGQHVLRAARDIAEIFLDLGLGGPEIDIASEHQHRVVRPVMIVEPRTDDRWVGHEWGSTVKYRMSA